MIRRLMLLMGWGMIINGIYTFIIGHWVILEYEYTLRGIILMMIGGFIASNYHLFSWIVGRSPRIHLALVAIAVLVFGQSLYFLDKFQIINLAPEQMMALFVGELLVGATFWFFWVRFKK